MECSGEKNKTDTIKNMQNEVALAGADQYSRLERSRHCPETTTIVVWFLEPLPRFLEPSSMFSEHCSDFQVLQ